MTIHPYLFFPMLALSMWGLVWVFIVCVESWHMHVWRKENPHLRARRRP